VEVYIEPSAIHFFSHIKIMLENTYGQSSTYNNTVIVLGYHLLPSLEVVRNLYPGKRVIVYQLEQHEVRRPWTTKKNKQILLSADEVWDYDIDNIEWLQRLWGVKSTLHPVRYTRALRGADNFKPQNDIVFYGAHNARRDQIIDQLRWNKLDVKWIGAYGDDLLTSIQDSKIVLNLHHYMPPRQEQTRIFIPIINGRCVISERSPRNYFDNMIIEVNTVEDMVLKCREMLTNDNWERFGMQAAHLFLEKGAASA
jgi:hypothetical protein